MSIMCNSKNLFNENIDLYIAVSKVDSTETGENLLFFKLKRSGGGGIFKI